MIFGLSALEVEFLFRKSNTELKQASEVAIISVYVLHRTSIEGGSCSSARRPIASQWEAAVLYRYRKAGIAILPDFSLPPAICAPFSQTDGHGNECLANRSEFQIHNMYPRTQD